MSLPHLSNLPLLHCPAHGMHPVNPVSMQPCPLLGTYSASYWGYLRDVHVFSIVSDSVTP